MPDLTSKPAPVMPPVPETVVGRVPPANVTFRGATLTSSATDTGPEPAAVSSKITASVSMKLVAVPPVCVAQF